MRSHEHRHPATGSRADEKAEATGVRRTSAARDRSTLQSLQRSAGNRAVAGMLSGTRTGPVAAPSAVVPVVSRANKLSAADTAGLRALEARLTAVSATASSRGASISAASDDCIRDLRDAKDHLILAAAAYRSAHDTFTGVLKRADKEYEFDEAVSGAVQGVIVAALLTVLLPEALLTTAAMAGARSLVSSTSAGLARAGIVIASVRAAAPAALGAAGNAAAGEVAEIATGASIGATQSSAGRPSDSANLGGPATTDKFAMVLGRLGTMIDALPSWGATGSSQSGIGLAASQLVTTAVKIRAGDSVEVTVADVERRSQALEDLDRLGASALPTISAIRNRMAALKTQALAVRIDDVTVIENQLWTSWIASQTGAGANEMLDNDVIEDYLGPSGKGMVDFGRYTSDVDQAEAVTAAQRRWLTSQGVEPGSNPSVTLSKFKAQRRLEEIRSTVVGQSGALRDGGRISVDGRLYDYAHNAGAFPAGTQMVALHVIIKPHLQGDVIVDQWTDDLFDVYCNPVTPSVETAGPTSEAGGGAPPR